MGRKGARARAKRRMRILGWHQCGSGGGTGTADVRSGYGVCGTCRGEGVMPTYDWPAHIRNAPRMTATGEEVTA